MTHHIIIIKYAIHHTTERDFAVSGPATWNSLPVELRTSSLSTQTFAQKLKTHLFGCERL